MIAAEEPQIDPTKPFNEEKAWHYIKLLRQYHREELDKHLISVRHYLRQNEAAQKYYACQSPSIVDDIKKENKELKFFERICRFFIDNILPR